MAETVRFSVLGCPEIAPPPQLPDRMWRVLEAVSGGSMRTAEVSALVHNPNAEKPGRERGKTSGALHILRDKGLISWKLDVVALTPAGEFALAAYKASK